MNVIRTIAILGVAIGFSSSVVVAAEGDKPKRPNMEELDADKDGTLSKAELEAVPEKFRARLLENDADKDGTLNKEEFAKAKEAADKRRAEREKNGGKPPEAK
jgi:lipoate-protein ligase A